MQMDTYREDGGGQVPLPGFSGGEPGGRLGRPAPVRRRGIRRARTATNLTAAALIVGASAATVALAHQALPAATAAAAGPAAATAGGNPATQGTTGPHAASPVATTSGSGTTSTVTRTVNGKTVITHVRHTAPRHDN